MKRTFLPALSVCLMLAAAPALAQYCSASSTSLDCSQAHEYISNVTVGTLNNSSACLNTPSYEDFTAVAPPTLPQASGTAIVVTISNWYSSSDTVTVFCDWNGNGTLNDGGEVFPLLQGPAGAVVPYSGTITPPVGAVASTRMRVRYGYSTSANPCGNITWSNAEDYTIQTSPPSGLVALGSVNPSTVIAGSPAAFTVTVTASAPPSPPTGVFAAIDLSGIGGAASQQMYDDGVTGGDLIPGDNVFTYTHSPAGNGTFLVAYGAVDGIGRTATGTVNISVVPFNDSCANATVVGLGANGPFNNVNATDSGVVGSCGTGYKDLWYVFTPPCTGNYKIDTCSPALFDTVLVAYSACGAGELGCNDDGNVGCGFTSEITNLPLTAGLPVWIRVASWSSVSTGSWILNVNQVFTVNWGSPFGPGSLQFNLIGGPLGGTYYHAVTGFAGAFPNGWLYGLDIGLPDIVAQINFGWPFVGTLDGCGNAGTPVFTGLPPITLYSVALASLGALSLPDAVSAPVTHTIP
jgi:hypothetical protein